MTGTGSTVSTGLGGWRWTATLAALALAALPDLLVVTDGGAGVLVELSALLVFAATSALALHGLRAGGDALLRSAGPAATLSLAGSVGLAVAVTGSGTIVGFGFVEGTTLTLLLVACWRRAAGRRQQAVAGLVALAVVALPARLGLSALADTAVIEALAVAVAAVAVATGSVLRSADASHQAAVVAVRRAEREDVARELHDVVAHHVTGMVVLTQAARTVAARPAPPAGAAAGAAGPAGSPGLDDALGAVERAGAEALASLRSMVAVLRSPDLDDPEDPDGAPLEPIPTVEELDEVVDRFRASGAVERVDLAVAPAARTLPPQVQAALVRVVQESLTNAARYARGASRVSVDLARAAGHAVLTVSDSGARADHAPGPGPGPGPGGGARWGGGFGIAGMRERVAALGGTLVAGPTSGPGPGTDPGAGGGAGGWTVRAEVPA